MGVFTMAQKEKSLLRQLIGERGIKDLDGVQTLVKELTSGMIQEIMERSWKTILVTVNTTMRTKRRITAGTGGIKRLSAAAKGKWNYPFRGTETVNTSRR